MLQVYPTHLYFLKIIFLLIDMTKTDRQTDRTFFKVPFMGGKEALVYTKKIHMNTMYQFLACSDFICIPPFYLQVLHLFWARLSIQMLVFSGCLGIFTPEEESRAQPSCHVGLCLGKVWDYRVVEKLGQSLPWWSKDGSNHGGELGNEFLVPRVSCLTFYRKFWFWGACCNSGVCLLRETPQWASIIISYGKGTEFGPCR